MRPVVLYDASVLYPSTLRDLLIRIAQTGLVQAKWTDEILDEVFRNLRENRPDLDVIRLERTRFLMNYAVRDCLVSGYQELVGVVQLPDPTDHHVLAAAIHARAQLIVTNNIRDFPQHCLTSWSVSAMNADEFVLELVTQSPEAVRLCVQQIASAWRDPQASEKDVLDRLERCGLSLRPLPSACCSESWPVRRAG